MTCCAKDILPIIRKGGAVLGGHISLAVHELFQIHDTTFAGARARIDRCRQCPQVTWLFPHEYARWLAQHGVEIVRNIQHLDTLPPLDSKPRKPNTKMFCTICKCHVPAKAYIAGERCPRDRWGDLS